MLIYLVFIFSVNEYERKNIVNNVLIVFTIADLDLVILYGINVISAINFESLHKIPMNTVNHQLHGLRLHSITQLPIRVHNCVRGSFHN